MNLVRRADILLPKDADMTAWSTVACDQFTSEPEYWQQVEELVGEIWDEGDPVAAAKLQEGSL